MTLPRWLYGRVLARALEVSVLFVVAVVVVMVLLLLLALLLLRLVQAWALT